MFTCGKGCKHTVFLALRAKDTQGKGHSGLCAQFVHMAHSFTTRALCTICSQ